MSYNHLNECKNHYEQKELFVFEYLEAFNFVQTIVILVCVK